MYSNPETQPNNPQSGDWLIEQLPGVSEADRAKLLELGITTTGQLPN
jgi:hypothetical protein